MKKVYLYCLSMLIFLSGFAQNIDNIGISRPIVNQMGYNSNEAKRFVCYGVDDGTPFNIYLKGDKSNKSLFKGKINGFSGDFTDFNPNKPNQEYIIKVANKESVPFWIAPYLMESLSSQLAYQFFIDARVSDNPIYSNEIKAAGGGPTRDVGAYGLETTFEILQYAANPSLYDQWHNDFKDNNVPDLIKLILWHSEFAFHHRDYNGKRGHGSYRIGYPNEEELQYYDYQNTLDHLASTLAAYHSFLKPYLHKHAYYRYRQFTKQNWEKYDRHKEVRFYVKGYKWVAKGWHEFNELGNVLGMGVIRNLMMYQCELNEKDGEPEKYLQYAIDCANDVIKTWDFNNPRHMWWIRNGEHLTPQALAYFLMVAPEHAPKKTVKKLKAWSKHMKEKTNNFWHYRKHSDTEWAHPKSKELGNTGLGGSMFAIAHLTNDPELRDLGWSQVNQVFGLNPSEAHYSHKDARRVKKNGYWKGVENGWPIKDPGGAGRLGAVRGTLDGTPLDAAFPFPKEKASTENKAQSHNHWYTTEGWGISNRSWQSTIIFSTLGSHNLKALDKKGNKIDDSIEKGSTITLKLNAALNKDWEKVDNGEINCFVNGKFSKKVTVTETDLNTGIFEVTEKIDLNKGDKVSYSYGYMGFETSIDFVVD